jgi:cation diffusion facilitator CzcD-associated flavoprotein CzcO
MPAPTHPLPTPDGLTQAARDDLAALGFPAPAWLPAFGCADGDVADVAIVGGGQSGLIAAAALKWDGLTDLRIFERSAPGAEGPWTTFARMETLRSPKTQVGSEFNVPSLSVRRWYEARHGAQAWSDLPAIPRTEWKAYLDWYAGVFDLTVRHGSEVLDIAPEGALVVVIVRREGRIERHRARAIVLATGFDGAGAWRVPAFVSDALPPGRYDHSNGPIDFDRLKGARIGVLGHGASAFDNATTALHAGAAGVDLCFRRPRLPRINPHRALENPALMTHYAELADETRWRIARFFRREDQSPPMRTFEKALALPGFRLRPATPWLALRERGGAVEVDTPGGRLVFDHLILATGLEVDLAARPELASLHDKVALWGERFRPAPGEEDARLASLPYLDGHFAFLPKAASEAWVTRVFAFNTSSILSHGPHSTSISGHRHALPRLVRGVERRLLLDAEAGLLPFLAGYAEPELRVADDFETRLAERDALRASA